MSQDRLTWIPARTGRTIWSPGLPKGAATLCPRISALHWSPTRSSRVLQETSAFSFICSQQLSVFVYPLKYSTLFNVMTFLFCYVKTHFFSRLLDWQSRQWNIKYHWFVLPIHLLPEASSISPGGQLHLKDPCVLTHSPPPSQTFSNISHSFISVNIKGIKISTI